MKGFVLGYLAPVRFSDACSVAVIICRCTYSRPVVCDEVICMSFKPQNKRWQVCFSPTRILAALAVTNKPFLLVVPSADVSALEAGHKHKGLQRPGQSREDASYQACSPLATMSKTAPWRIFRQSTGSLTVVRDTKGFGQNTLCASNFRICISSLLQSRKLAAARECSSCFRSYPNEQLLPEAKEVEPRAQVP